MNAYTRTALEALKELHSMKSGTPEFIRGGAVADKVLARGIRWLERRDYNECDYGGPLAVALHVAMNSVSEDI